MAGIATGVFKKLSLKKQVSLGAMAAAGAAGSARYARRVTSTIDLAKASYQSNEMLQSQQRRDMRHGVRSVAGTISGELSVGGYQLPMESVLRQLSQTAATTNSQTTISATAVGNNTGIYNRSAGSFITDGFNVGDVVNTVGFTTTGADNNNQYAVVTALTATAMSLLVLDGTPIVTKAAGDGVTVSVVGKKTWIPSSGQTRDYYTIEHFFADIGQSERFTDCVFTGFTATLPPTGMATIEFPVMGLNMQTGQAEYFTTPAPAPTGPILAAVNGALIINGVVAGLVTGLTITVNGNYSVPGGVVGANVDPDVFPGPVDVTGQITVLFQDATFRDAFINETESVVVAVLTGSNVAAPLFTSFVMPRVKYSGSTKDDTNAGLTLTMPFTALENTGSVVGGVLSTISVQDASFI
jgi:hypothetical protein